MSKAAFIPVLLQVLMTLGLLFALGRSRVAAVKRGEVAIRDIALRGGEDRWPVPIRQIGASYQTQFELPTLFFACVALAVVANATTTVFIALEWAFVLSRAAHSYIHVTSNHVPTRFNAFLVGVCVLAALWGALALHVLSS